VEKGKCVVAFSGGKDSTVLLHLALQVDPELRVFHWDHGSQLMPREFEEEIIANARQIGAKNLVVKGSSLLERSDARSNFRVWYLVFWNTLHMTRRAEAWDFQFVGLRKEESCKRRVTIAEHKQWGEVYPLADWSWRDVWAYIVSKNLPYPKVYDVYGPVLGWDQARLVTFFDQEFEKFGSLYLDGFFFPQYRNLGKNLKVE
jgi:phosphoadenosine phosphosulfate reductase